MSYVSFEADGSVGYMTLDRPPANSYDLEVMQQFGAAVDEAVSSGVNVVILRSASEKFFCAGADIKRFIENDVAGNMEMIRVSHAAFDRMAAAKPIFIAHINAHALGGGLELALACDIRIANDGNYKLGLPEVTLGLLPGNGGTQRMTRLLGPSRAMGLLINGGSFSPQQGHEWGLIHELVPAEGAAEAVRAYADKLSAGASEAVAAIKRCIQVGGDQSLADGLQLERDEMEKLFASADATEGLNAFVEKRKAAFS